MVHDIKMPKVAMAMNEGTITEWLVEDGAKIVRNQSIFTIETEKTAYEVEATHEGYIQILSPADTTVEVEAIVGKIATTEEELQQLNASSVETSPVIEEQPNDSGKPDSAETQAAASNNLASTPTIGSADRIKASPLAKRLAKESSIELSNVTGTGPHGRIKKRDIEAYTEAAAKTNTTMAPVGFSNDTERNIKARVPMQGMRAKIAEKLQLSNQETAHTHIFGEIDFSQTKALRDRYKAMHEKLGTKISYNAIFMKAMAVAAKQVPIANATLVDNEIILWKNINIGLAIATPGTTEWDSGLIVPVVKNVQSKGLVEIENDIRRLVAAAKNNSLTADDLQGGTMTLSPTAGFWPGYGTSTAIVNCPEVLILQPSMAVNKPVVVDGVVVIRPILPVSLTMDHRVLDGAPFGKFYTVFHECIASPDLMLI